MRDRRDHRAEPQRSTARIVVWAVALALLVLFIAQNFVMIEVRLAFWRVDLRLAYALLGAGLLGFVLGWLLPRVRR